MVHISQVREINDLTQSVTIGVVALTRSTLGWFDDRSFSGWQPILKYSGNTSMPHAPSHLARPGRSRASSRNGFAHLLPHRLRPRAVTIRAIYLAPQLCVVSEMRGDHICSLGRIVTINRLWLEILFDLRFVILAANHAMMVRYNPCFQSESSVV